MKTTTAFDIRREPNSNPANLLLASYAFTSTPQVPDKDEDERYLQQRSDDKIYFSYLDNEPVARVGVVPMTQNVRGKVITMGGISGVCSMPAARRGGHIRALMNHAIEEMHADGQPVSTLYPFKTSYYEMFGYAGWQLPMWARIDPAALAPYIKCEKHGTVRQRLSTDVKDDVYMFLQDTQSQVHGMARHPRTRFDSGTEKYPTWFMTVTEDDRITAGMTYKLNLDKQAMEVQAVCWHTLNGMVNMFDFMARHVDQVKQIRMPILEGQHPSLWITDNSQLTILSNEDYSWGGPMGRIVTLASLNGIPVGDAEATVTVTDTQAPWNNGIWTLSGQGGELTVTEGGTPGGEVSINGLSSMLFCGLEPLTLPHRGWGSVNDETANALRTLFPQITPHLHELF